MEPTERKMECEVSSELIKQIENSQLGVERKVELLLVAAGLKPCSRLDLTIRNEENVFLTDEDLESIESIIRSSGLAFKIGEREVETYEREDIETGKKSENTIESIEILVSRSEAELQQLLEIIKRLPSQRQVESGEYDKEQAKANGRALGLAYGYPESAVDAFADEKLKDKKSLPRDVKKREDFAFSDFGLSEEEDKWREELKRGQEWASWMKDKSPKIYDEMMARARAIWLDEE